MNQEQAHKALRIALVIGGTAANENRHMITGRQRETFFRALKYY